MNRIVVSSFFETEISSGLGPTILPLTINGLFFIVQCFFIGKKASPNEENKDEEENKVDYNKLYPTLKENITIVIFSVAFFACFIVAYFLKFLVIDAYDAGLDFYESFSCHSVVSDTNENSSALAVLGFIFITLLSVNITLLVISLCSVFSKSKSFGSVSRGYIVTSFTSVFALWIISNYYLAFIKTTPAFIEVLFPQIDTIYPDLDTDIAHFIILSEILGPFVLSAVLIVAFVILKPITKLENILDKKKMAYGNGLWKWAYRWQL